jgi:hypothetical protein
VGPPIYAPTTPTVVGYQPGAAALPPTLTPSTTLVPAPATTYVPPRTTVVAPAPVVAAPAPVAVPATCQTCAPAPRVTGYAPPTYRTNWVQVPVTTYRPVAAVDPATGLPINAVQPCTTTTWQARRVPNSLWGGLWPSSSPPPSVVAYTPATIAAYPAYPGTVTNYAPAPVIIAPNVRTSNYAPVYAAPVVTNYVPAAPAVTYAPPPATTYAPAPATTVVPSAPAPYCPPTTAAPATTTPFPAVPSTGYAAPPAMSGDAASIAPRLETPAAPTIRNYPREYDNQPVVPVTPPERRVIDVPPPPVIEAPRVQQPSNSGASTRPSVPFIPFARPEKPASTVVPERNLRLVPDPDASKLELRKDQIPNLIQPGDRQT